MNIAITIDDNYAQHCAAMLQSLFVNSKAKHIFHIYILTEGLTLKNQNRLTALIEKYGNYCFFKKIDKNLIANAPISLHISLATYYRLFIPALIPPDIDKILFLDADIIIKQDINAFYDLNFEQNAIIACKDPWIQNRKGALEIPFQYDYFNAGVLLMNLKKWRNEKIALQIIKYIRAYSFKLKYWDQDALNANLFADVKIVSNKWNAVEDFFRFEFDPNCISKESYSEARNNPAIIHFTSPRKPWHWENRHPYKKEYQYYLSQTAWKNYSYPLDFLKRALFFPFYGVKELVRLLTLKKG